MKEIFWLEDGICGRCGPRKCAWDLQQLWDSGVRAIMCMGDVSLSPDDAKYGFQFFEGKLPGSLPPTEADEAVCRATLPRAYDFLSEQVAKGEGTTLIHCFGGIDRTGFLMVYYLYRKYGTPFQAGLEQVRKVRPNALTALGWEDMARRVIQ